MRNWFQSGIFRTIFLSILLVSIVPLMFLGIFTFKSAGKVGDTVIVFSQDALDDKMSESLKLRAIETANAIAMFLKEREADLMCFALLPRDPDIYLTFCRTHRKQLWYEENGQEIREPVLLYREAAFIGPDGSELIKISEDRIAGPDDLYNVEDPRHTLFKSETYFKDTMNLPPGGIRVSPVTGYYVNREDFLKGRRFKGVMRFSMPVYDHGMLAGIIVLSLDSRHIEEFSAHIVPTEDYFTVAPDPATGNYAYIIDRDAKTIGHPVDYLQWGVDQDGVPLPHAIKNEDLGRRPVLLDKIGFADKDLAAIHGRAAKGETGTIRYHWDGRHKFVAFAPIPYTGGDYRLPAGFGWIGISADIRTFHEAALKMGYILDRKVHMLFYTTLIILLITGMAVLFTAAVLARRISSPIRKLTRAVRNIEQGGFESARLVAGEIHSRDEIGALAAGFDKMTDRLMRTMLGLEQELHERKRTEKALQASEARYRTLFERVPAGLYRTTPAGHFLDANNTFLQILAYRDKDDLLSLNAVQMYMNPSDRNEWRKRMEEEGIVRDFEVRLRCFDGKGVWVRNTARAIKNEAGNITFYEGCIEDINLRKQTEKELERHRENLEELVRARTIALKKVNNHLKNVLSQITESLQYAKTIQYSLLPDLYELKMQFADSFVIWSPREIVGGDFIHMDVSGSSLMLAVVDCTGHGVPGAFMTIIACAGLRRIVNDEGCRDPAEILNRLNRFVKMTLRQDTHPVSSHRTPSDDGMDAAVICIEKNEQSGLPGAALTYAGARLPLIFTENKKVRVIKGDRQSIGYKRSDVTFKYINHNITIKKQSAFYLFTDGFTDQLGGERGIVFGMNRLKNFLEEIMEKPFDVQQETLIECFETYRGENDQVDDMAAVGFKVI